MGFQQKYLLREGVSPDALLGNDDPHTSIVCCLLIDLQKVMRKTYHQLWAGKEPLVPAPHIEHCLDTLRQDLMCKADDTPMPSLELMNGGGENQNMHCKNFDKLVAWTQAPERNACYKRLYDYKPIVHSVERYAFCPSGSEHYDTMDQYFKDHGHFADPFSE